MLGNVSPGVPEVVMRTCSHTSHRGNDQSLSEADKAHRCEVSSSRQDSMGLRAQRSYSDTCFKTSEDRDEYEHDRSRKLPLSSHETIPESLWRLTRFPLPCPPTCHSALLCAVSSSTLFPRWSAHPPFSASKSFSFFKASFKSHPV